MLLAEKISLLTDLENSFKLQLKKVQSEKKQLAKKQAKIEKLYALQLELTTDPDTADTVGGGCQVNQLQPITIEIFDDYPDEAIAQPIETTPEPEPTTITPEVQQTETTVIGTELETHLETATDLPESQETEQTTDATEAIAEPEIITEQPTDKAIAEVVPDVDTTVEALEIEPTHPPTTVNPELEAMSIRKLKALASEAKVKGYGNMTKPQLIEALRKLS